MHIIRGHGLWHSRFEDCNLKADPAYGKNGWQGEPLKLVTGGDCVIRNCTFSGARIVFGPLELPENVDDTFEGLTVENSTLPWMNLYSGLSNAHFEDCQIKGGEARAPYGNRTMVEAGFVNTNFYSSKMQGTLGAVGYRSCTVKGVKFNDSGSIPDALVF